MASVHIYDAVGNICILEHVPELEDISLRGYKNGHMSDVHQHHDELEIVYVEKGRGSVRVNEINYPIHSGNIVVYNPKTFHKEIFLSSGQSPLLYYLKLRNLRINGLADGHLIAQGESPVIECGTYDNIVMSMCGTLFDEWGRRAPGYETVVERIVFMMIMLIVLLRGEHAPRENEERVAMPFEQIKLYIEKNYMHRISLEEIAGRLHLNYCYMSHLFKDKYDLSPKKYIIACRIQEAERLLRETCLPIQEICRLVGYANQSHFNVQFREAKGVTPLAYRQSMSVEQASERDSAAEMSQALNWRSVLRDPN